MDRGGNFEGRGRGRSRSGNGGGRGQGRDMDRGGNFGGRGGGISISKIGGGRGQGRDMDRGGNFGGRGRSKSGNEGGRSQGRGRGSSYQPQGPSPRQHISNILATAEIEAPAISTSQPPSAARASSSTSMASANKKWRNNCFPKSPANEMKAPTISTSKPPSAAGASSSTFMASAKKSAEEFNNGNLPSGSITFGNFLATQMEALAISTSQRSTAAGTSSSTSMASAKESAEESHSARLASGSISSEKIPSSSVETKEETGRRSEGDLVPVNRPDGGGRKAIREIKLVANHFRVIFNSNLNIYHYNFVIERVGNGPRASKEDALKIKKQLVNENPESFGDAMIVFDRRTNIYSTVDNLPQRPYTVNLPRDEFLVELRRTEHELNVSSLIQFLNTNEKNHVELQEDLVQCLDLVLREHPYNENRILVGRSLYPKKSPPIEDIGGGLLASRGHYQSLRPTAQGLVLNVDLSTIAFPKNISVFAYLRQSCQVNCREAEPLSEIDIGKARKALKGLKVEVTHRNCSRKFTIKGLTRQITEDIEIQQNHRMLDYFFEKYDTVIRYRKLPCLDVTININKPNYIPMELCVLCEYQKFPLDKLSNSQKNIFNGISRPSPSNRQWEIKNIVNREDGPLKGRFLPHFGLKVDGNMTKLTGRVLEVPKILLKDELQVKLFQDDPQWNLIKENRVFDGKQIENWGLINFSRNGADSIQVKGVLKLFERSLVRRCGEVGVPMNRNPRVDNYYNLPMSLLENFKDLKETLLAVHGKAKGELQILICVMAEKHDGYNTLKLIAETDIGLVTQCCLYNQVAMCSDYDQILQLRRRPSGKASQYLANLALKINAKVGGSNAAVTDQLPRFSNDRVMYIGADVNHPGPGDTTSPSIAAMVGSINWPWCNRYNARISYQTNRKESIENLKEMSKELLGDYLETNKRLPDRILFFRDGVSESQFHKVLNVELPAFKEAVAQFKELPAFKEAVAQFKELPAFKHYNPLISVIVAQKRHHTRLFLGEGKDSVNVPPGTVVDTVIVHPRQFDFYLCSHKGLQGTSKPTHYHVLSDENGFRSDELQTLINNLCYTFARCTKPVSLVPPVYYADLAAYRGRRYYQGSENRGTPRKLHDRVKNTMFFC